MLSCGQDVRIDVNCVFEGAVEIGGLEKDIQILVFPFFLFFKYAQMYRLCLVVNCIMEFL